MLRQDQQIRTQLFRLKDTALVCAALWAAHELRGSFPPHLFGISFQPIAPFGDYLWLYLIVIPCAPLILESMGFYRRPYFGPRREVAWVLLKSCLLTTLVVILFVFLFRLAPARGVVVLFGCASFLFLFLSDELFRLAFRSRLGQLQLARRVILVGSPGDTARLRGDLNQVPHQTLQIVDELDLAQKTVADLVVMLHDTSATGVIITAKHVFFDQIEKAIHACELEGVEAWLVADFFRTHIARTSSDELYGRPVLVFRSAPAASWQGVFKELLDVTLALVFGVLLLPFWVVVALVIKVSSPGPVLFRQRRSGRNGQPFAMFKFRTMADDAEQRQRELAGANEMDGPVFKVTNDPRVTAFGRFLRKYSIDETPQLLNIIKGEMSFVGPRPLPVEEVKRFDDPAHRRRLSVKPGLTGLWQVSGRSNVSDFREWVRLDLEYIDTWSLWLDLKILWRTIPAVLSGTGAK